MVILRLLLCAVLVGAGCVLVGCGPGSDTVPVSGIVTYQGQPLAEVEVTFFPEEGRPASGVTNASGRYTLSTFASNDGAIPGEHRVVITEHYPPEAPPPFPRRRIRSTSSSTTPTPSVPMSTTPSKA